MPVLDPYGDPLPNTRAAPFRPYVAPPATPSPPSPAPALPAPAPYEPAPYEPAAYQPPPVASFPGFATDPGVVQATGAENLGLANATQSLNDARNQAIIRWGDPALAGLAGFGVDPQAAAFAKQNYLSGNADLARLDKAKEDRKRALINRLASRGILFSGETGYQEGQNNLDYGTSRYDAQNRLLDYLHQLSDQFLQQKQNFRAGTLGAYQSAYDRYASNPYAYLGTG